MFNKKQFIYSFAGLIALLLLIGYGGPKLSRFAFEKEKATIDKNGVCIKAEVYFKKQFKGHVIYFRYQYKNTSYNNHEQNGDYYEKVNINDSVSIKIDTTAPENSYLITATE
jgi:hypothetical protein